MKKISIILAATLLAGGLCAYAEKEERKKGGPPEGRPSREELLKKFDKDGAYTRRFCPELADLPDKYLFAPWTAPKAVLDGAGVRLGETYPRPVVDLKQSREDALAAFARLREGAV